MPTIQVRKTSKGEKRYTAQVRLDGCPHVSATFPNRKDAKDWAQRVEYDLRQRIRGDAPLERHTMGELLDRYRREVMRPEWEDWYGRQLTWWERHLGDRYLDEIRPPTVAALRDRLQQEPGKGVKGRRRSNATVNRYLAALSALMTFGAREDVGWVLHHPVRGVTRLTEPRGRVRFLSRAADDDRVASDPEATRTSELHRLLDACRQSANRDLLDIVTLAILTGCRRSEIMALRFDWIHADGDGFSLPSEITKNREARFVPLIGEATALVTKRVAGRAPGRLYLFSRGRQPRRFPRRAWLTALRRAGVENFRFHDLRHTHASYLAMAGSSTRELMDALGHRTPAMAVRYSHFSDEHKVRVAERLRDQLGDL